jgi:hypothetical protein
MAKQTGPKPLTEKQMWNRAITTKDLVLKELLLEELTRFNDLISRNPQAKDYAKKITENVNARLRKWEQDAIAARIKRRPPNS